MKRTILSTLMGLLIFGGLIFSNSCKKDTECKCVITVKHLSDTNKIVKQCSVYVGKYAVSQSDFTDEAGQVRLTFKNEAILDIYARIDTSTDPLFNRYLAGQGSIRLLPGETVQKSVYLSPL
jgi:hypothetical protein